VGYNKQLQQNKRDAAREARDGKPKRKLAFGDYRFCRIELTASERDEARAYVSGLTAPLVGMGRYIAAGYTIKFSADPNGNAVQVSVTCAAIDNGDAGLILTARGASEDVAWGVFLYKDLVICDGRTWRETEHERGGSYQDIG